MLNKPHNTLVADYEHVVEVDPCFDTTAAGWDDAWEKFLASGDWKELPRGSGEPTVFTLRHLRGQAKIRVQSLLADDRTRFLGIYLAARYAIVAVKNAVIENEPLKIVQDRDPDTGAAWVAEDQMATLYDLWPQAVISVATRAMTKMHADPS